MLKSKSKEMNWNDEWFYCSEIWWLWEAVFTMKLFVQLLESKRFLFVGNIKLFTGSIIFHVIRSIVLLYFTVVSNCCTFQLASMPYIMYHTVFATAISEILIMTIFFCSLYAMANICLYWIVTILKTHSEISNGH